MLESKPNIKWLTDDGGWICCDWNQRGFYDFCFFEAQANKELFNPLVPKDDDGRINFFDNKYKRCDNG